MLGSLVIPSMPRLPLLRAALVPLAAAALTVLFPGAAAAQRRVIVEAFTGPQAASARNSLVADFSDQDDVAVIPRAEVDAAKERLGLARRAVRGDDVPQLARELRASAVILGRVSRQRRRWSLILTVLNGADGADLGRETWSGRTASAINAVRHNGYRRLEDELSASALPAGPRRVQRTGPRDRRGARTGRRRGRRGSDAPSTEATASADASSTSGDEASGGDVPWYARGRGQDEDERARPPDEERPGGDGEDEAEPSAPVEVGSRFDALSVEIVGGIDYRWMSADALVNNICGMGFDAACRDDRVMATTIDETRSYTSGAPGHAEVGLRLEVFPGAFGATQPIPWLGLVLEARHSLFLATKLDQGATVVDVGTEQFDYYLGGAARFRFGDRRGAPEIRADLGYGVFSFLLDPEDLKMLPLKYVVPPLQYSFVHIGLGVSYAIVPVHFIVGVRGAFRAGVGVGDDAKSIWGLRTGGSTAFQLGIDLRTETPFIVDGTYIGLSFEYSVFTTSFQGQTRCTLAGGGCTVVDPWEPWPYSNPADPDNSVSGGIADPVNDNYIRVYLTLGWAFR